MLVVGAVLISGLVASRLFPPQVVDLYWARSAGQMRRCIWKNCREIRGHLRARCFRTKIQDR